MTLADYLDDLNAHPPQYPLDVWDVAELAAVSSAVLFAVYLVARMLMPVRTVVVDLSPRTMTGLASVIADINAEAMIH